MEGNVFRVQAFGKFFRYLEGPLEFFYRTPTIQAKLLRPPRRFSREGSRHPELGTSRQSGGIFWVPRNGFRGANTPTFWRGPGAYDRPEIVDFGAAGRPPCNRETVHKDGKLRPPPLWKVSRPPGAARTQNRRSPIGQKHRVAIKKQRGQLAVASSRDHSWNCSSCQTAFMICTPQKLTTAS